MGQYLDVAGNQKCHSCPEGTYSVGNGIRYDNWEKIPEEFTTTKTGVVSFRRKGQTCDNSTRAQ